MDSDFSRLLHQIAVGEIDDLRQVQQIIGDARTAIAAKQEALNKMRALLLLAQEAVLTGNFEAACS